MLHWIGWIALVAFAVVSAVIASYTAAMTYGAAHDQGGSDFGFGILVSVLAAAACLFATATTVVCSIVAYNWTPWG